MVWVEVWLDDEAKGQGERRKRESCVCGRVKSLKEVRAVRQVGCCCFFGIVRVDSNCYGFWE